MLLSGLANYKTLKICISAHSNEIIGKDVWLIGDASGQGLLATNSITQRRGSDSIDEEKDEDEPHQAL